MSDGLDRGAKDHLPEGVYGEDADDEGLAGGAREGLGVELGDEGGDGLGKVDEGSLEGEEVAGAGEALEVDAAGLDDGREQLDDGLAVGGHRAKVLQMALAAVHDGVHDGGGREQHLCAAAGEPGALLAFYLLLL